MEINIWKGWRLALKWWPPRVTGWKKWVFHFKLYHLTVNHYGFQVMVFGLGFGIVGPPY